MDTSLLWPDCWASHTRLGRSNNLIMPPSIFLIVLIALAIYQTYRDRSLRNMGKRVKFLEEREDELTKALMAVNKESERCADLRRELERILPPMRRALATFDQFNKTY